MVIYEILDTNSNVKNWKCIFDNGKSVVYPVGDIFLMWAAGDALREEKRFSNYAKRCGNTKGYDAPIYEESLDKRLIRECIEREDMAGLLYYVN